MDNLVFRTIKEYKKARHGIIETAHGKIETPVFMPVGTTGSVKAIFPKDLEKLNVQIILGNTYHLMLRPGEKLISKMGGLQKFMSWDKPILTDSGGFQIWSLSKIREVDKNGVTFRSHIDGKEYRLTPKRSINIQRMLNSNITMALDECTAHPSTYNDTLESVNLTKNWAKKSIESYEPRSGFGIFAIVQGGMYKDLRDLSINQLKEYNFDGYALGGLSVGETHNEMKEIINHSVFKLPTNKPRYLMGVGRPVDIFMAVTYGVDMFDCVLPTRFGRNGRAFTTNEGEINLKNSCYSKDASSLDPKLDCFVSREFSRSYIHHLTKSNEILSSMILSLHNIAFYQKMMFDIRESIKSDNFENVKKNYLKIHGKYEKT